MPTIELETEILAPIERVFDLARSIDLHTDSTSGTDERAIAGVTTGLIGLHQEVTWSAKHFGVRQKLSVRVVEFQRPTAFRDCQIRGIFQRLDHTHRFEPIPDGTRMRDIFDYASPLGFLGHLADTLFLERYMRSFLIERNRILKSIAESEEWRTFLPG